MFQITPQLFEKIKHFARFPQTGVSLRQMVMFGKALSYSNGERVANLPRYLGQRPSPGTLFKASQFLHGKYSICIKRAGYCMGWRSHGLQTQSIIEELPIRLAHRVKELEELPRGLNKMPSILKVKDWYANSFKVKVVVDDGLDLCIDKEWSV